MSYNFDRERLEQLKSDSNVSMLDSPRVYNFKHVTEERQWVKVRKSCVCEVI